MAVRSLKDINGFCLTAIQWFRHRFNDCFDKAEWTKSRSPEEMPESASYAEKLIYDKAIELVSVRGRFVYLDKISC